MELYYISCRDQNKKEILKMNNVNVNKQMNVMQTKGIKVSDETISEGKKVMQIVFEPKKPS